MKKYFLTLLFCSVAASFPTWANSKQIDPALLSSIPQQLHIISPDKQALPVKIRPATVAEVKLLLKSDESGERLALEYWKKNPSAYYRWDADTEQGLISDIVKEFGIALMDGNEVPPDSMPRVVLIQINGQEKIVGFATSFMGDVKFHSDSELRRQGYSGIGTVLVAEYLKWVFENKSGDAYFDSVNRSYGFYEKLGFIFSDPNKVPHVLGPDGVFPMHLPGSQIPQTLLNIWARDQEKTKGLTTSIKSSTITFSHDCRKLF